MYEIFEQLCQRDDVTPYKVSKLTGVPQSALSNWKNGKSEPNIKTLDKLADFFHVSVDYLKNGESDSEKYYLNEETAQAAQEIFNNKELRALFDVQRDMESADLLALYNMALALKRKERGDMDDSGC